MRPTLSLKTHTPARIFTCLCFALATTLSVSAASLDWTGAVNGNWDTTTPNWFNGSTSTVYNNGDDVTFSDTTATSNITNTSGVFPGSVLVNNSTLNYSFAGGGIGGNGGLTKNGSGTLTLATSNSYTGPTTINGGTLALVLGGTFPKSSPIIVSSGTTLDVNGRSDGTLALKSGQTLGGAGSISGHVTVAPGAAIAPGDSTTVGTLTFDNNLTLAGNALIKLSIATGQNDMLTGISALSYSGTLTVNNLGVPLTSGDSFTLFSASTFSGNFASIVGSPGPGLVYVFHPGTGVLDVTNVPISPSATNIFVHAAQPKLICVHFDRPIEPTAAANTDNYTLYTKGVAPGSVSITNAVLQDDGQSVALYLDNPAGEFFAVSADNIISNSVGSNLTVNATGYTGNFTTAVIGTTNDPSPAGQVLSLFDDTFNLTSGGSDIGGTNDHCQFVYQPVVGDFDVATLVTGIHATDPGSKAGLMAREFLTPNSRMVGTFFTTLSLGIGTNQIQMTERAVSNSAAFNSANPIPSASLGWLRLTRANNTFTTYYGTNGQNWTTSSVVAGLVLSSNLFVGLTGTSHTNGDTSTASFTAFGVLGARPGDGTKPTVSAYVYAKTNLVIKWQRTPRDFTVQVGFNLSNTNYSNGAISNATQWAFLLLPVYDTALTGTNAAVPTPGRYMTIPTSMFPNQPLYIRLAQVDRVIPDPPGVTAGTIFSQASGGTVGPPGLNALCGTAMIASNAVASASTPIVTPNSPAGKYTYQFTTEPSGSNYNTIISVRPYTAVGSSNCDTAFTAGSGKSQVKVTPGISVPNTQFTNYGYTFVAAPTTPATVCNPVRVRVNIITNF